MKALVLEGGGVKGSYQIGAYEALMELGYHFDCVVGASVGAINAALIASNQFKDLKDFWSTINVGEVFNLSETLVSKINNSEYDLELAKEVAELLKQQGIELDVLKNLINSILDKDLFYNSKIDFGLVTVKRKDLEPVEIFKKDIPREKLTDYLIASCYLPVFKKEKLIDNNYYFDGGFHDLCPVDMLLNKGYDDIIAIRVKGIGLFKKVKNAKENVLYLEPSRPLGSILCLDNKRVRGNIRMGYLDTLRYFKKYDGVIYTFKKHNNHYYHLLNFGVNKELYQRVSSFFESKNEKETIINAVEYIFKRNNVDYDEIYDLRKELKKIRKELRNKDSFIEEYLLKLRLF